MDHSSKQPTRKEALRNLIVLPALAAMVVTSTGIAQAKASKAQFKYQDKPNGKAQCSGCALFVPGSSKTANGTCNLVDGSISPNGWCTGYAAKSK
jgi:hypothetical protein